MKENLEWFKSQQWKMVIFSANKSFSDIVKIYEFKVTERSTLLYNITMRMGDSVGFSNCTGILTHQADYFGLKFEKTYDNKYEAGQFGDFDLLLYEGIQ